MGCFVQLALTHWHLLPPPATGFHRLHCRIFAVYTIVSELNLCKSCCITISLTTFISPDPGSAPPWDIHVQVHRKVLMWHVDMVYLDLLTR
jgi:hypothetical protein